LPLRALKSYSPESVSEHIKARIFSKPSEYKISIWNFYKVYVLVPYETNLLVNAHQSIIDPLDCKLTFFKATKITANRLEPKVAQFCHFVLYELNNFDSKQKPATFAGIKYIFYIIHVVRTHRLKAFLKLYPLYPLLYTITGRPFEESKPFPSLQVLTQNSNSYPNSKLDFLTVDSLMSLLSEL